MWTTALAIFSIFRSSRISAATAIASPNSTYKLDMLLFREVKERFLPAASPRHPARHESLEHPTAEHTGPKEFQNMRVW